MSRDDLSRYPTPPGWGGEPPSVGDILAKQFEQWKTTERRPRKKLTTARQRAARKAGLTAWAYNREQKLRDAGKGGRASFGEGSAASLRGYELAMRRWHKDQAKRWHPPRRKSPKRQKEPEKEKLERREEPEQEKKGWEIARGHIAGGHFTVQRR